MNNLNALQGQ